MVSQSLEELIKQSITDIRNGKIDKRVTSFTDYKNKYAVLKPKVVVRMELAEGIVADVDVTDFFEKEVA